ncbi:MAG: hypothetical protein DMG93_06360 [Acidobacteria bacterium]|nr:MAG: hypothetical protein DMG93_06360 [Acidobacteriota bacterium]
MKNKSFCNRAVRRPAISFVFFSRVLLLACLLLLVAPAFAGDAPQWVHTQVNAMLPAHDEKTDAVLLYSETNVTVISTDKIKTVERRVYKILRPDGRGYGIVFVPYRSPGQKVNSIRGWCIPAQGKDYEVKDKDAADVSLPNIDGAELISDIREKLLRIPASDPGNVVGYEYEVEENPFVLQDGWDFQNEAPARESHYSLSLPPGWEYKSSFLNYPEVKPAQSGNNQWQWVVTDVKGVRSEPEMPPMQGLLGQMIISFFPPQGPKDKEFSNWPEMGRWYWNLERGRVEASPDIKEKVSSLTVDKPHVLDKMKALANFVQDDIRYVAIELGIGGWQPHPAPEIFTHHYGDCKDKATLMGSMLHEIGVNSFQVAINTDRGSVTPSTPAHRGFNHVILAIKLPDGLSDPSLVAVMQHPTLGKLLFFDPTNELTPFGQIGGYLQENYGLLVTPEGGELVELPKQPGDMNGIRRSAKLTLSESGMLTGDVEEFRVGDRAAVERWKLRTVTNDKDRLKAIEELVSGSLSNFQITKASIVNFTQTSEPFGFRYSFAAQNYAKNAGGLLLVRPRIIGVKSKALLETKEPRQFPVEFEGPVRDTDSFEITIPAGYVVDDLPEAVDAEFGFASYHSKTEAKGNVLNYTRTFEVKELSVPVSKADELKKFYRIIASDERNTAVLKPAK